MSQVFRNPANAPVSIKQAAADAAVQAAAALDAATKANAAQAAAIAASTPASHAGAGGAAHALATTSSAGFLSAPDKTKIDAITGSNTGDETTATIRSKLGVTTLSGSNTGDQTTVTGNAGTADRLATPRTINGVSFDGSADITILPNVNDTSDMNKPVSTAQAAALVTKAPLDSPNLTGTPTVPTAAPGTNTDQTASTSFAMVAAANAVAALVAGSPAMLDTLSELASAIGGDADFAATTATALGNRLRVDVGTQALTTTQKSNALTNLGIPSVDNTSDANKPVSTAQAAADAAVQAVAASDATTKADARQAALVSGTNIRTVNGNTLLGSGDLATGDVTLTGTQTLTNKTLTAPSVNGYTEGVTTASTGTAYTINITTASVQILTLTGNCTYTFPAAVAGKSFLLVQKQDATGSRTATWPAAVKWPSGTAPTLTATANKSDVFGFTCDGTSWYGRVIGSAYA